MCQQCDDNSQPVAFCQTCSEYLCEECLIAHKRLKAYRGHKAVTLTPGEILDVQPQSKKTYNCSIHPEEILKLYCKDCKSLACVLCFLNQHNGHNIVRSDSKARKEVEESVTDLVKQTNSKLMMFEDNLKYITAVEQEKTEASNPLKAQVNETVDKLIKQLETRREELLKEIDDTFTKDLKSLWADKEFHETAITNMQGALSFAQRSLACQEDTEVLALCAQVIPRLKELSRLTWDSTDTEKTEITTVEFKETVARVTRNESPLVGQLQPIIVKPCIEIITDKQNYNYFSGDKRSILVAATVKANKCKNKFKISVKKTSFDGKSGEGVKFKIIENSDQNNWRINLKQNSTIKSTYLYIDITVRGVYAGYAIKNNIQQGIEFYRSCFYSEDNQEYLPYDFRN